MSLPPDLSRQSAPSQEYKHLPVSRMTWDLSPLFDSDTDPRIAAERHVIDSASKEFESNWGGDRTDYLNDPGKLKEVLDSYADFLTKYGNGGGNAQYYFNLRTTQDKENPDLKAQAKVTDNFKIDVMNRMRFLPLNISRIPAEKQDVFRQAPELEPYTHWLEKRWAEAKHVLTDKEENILALTEPGSYDAWVNMNDDFLSRRTPQVLTEDGVKAPTPFGSLRGRMNSPKKEVRDDAAKAYNEIVADEVDVAEYEINAVLERKARTDKLRGYDRPDAERHLNDDIDSTTVDAMLTAVESRNDISQRLYRLKAQLLGVDKLEYHERNVPVASADETKKYPFQESVDIVYTVMDDLDPEFGSILSQFVSNGQIDAEPRKGKEQGAYCASDRLTTPVYIKLNHTNTIDDVTTIAHELGHGVNTEYMRRTQNELNFATPLATAEVASTFMEDFVFQKLLEGVTPEQRLALSMEKLDGEISAIHRQVACYRFEQSLHEEFRKEGRLSKKRIGELFRNHMAAYMGEAVEQSPGSENWWVTWPHIRNPFYVYSYASGLLISKSLQKAVKEDPGAINQVKEFLSAGTSDSPRNIFLKTGIDIGNPQFWSAGLDEIESLLVETENLARTLGKIK